MERLVMVLVGTLDGKRVKKTWERRWRMLLRSLSNLKVLEVLLTLTGQSLFTVWFFDGPSVAVSEDEVQIIQWVVLNGYNTLWQYSRLWPLFTQILSVLSADNDWMTWIGKATCGLGVCDGKHVMWKLLRPVNGLSLENYFFPAYKKASSFLCMSQVVGI